MTRKLIQLRFNESVVADMPLDGEAAEVDVDELIPEFIRFDVLEDKQVIRRALFLPVDPLDELIKESR